MGAAVGTPRPRRWRHPDTWHLRTKLVLATMLLLVTASSIIGTLLYASMDSVLTRQLDSELAAASHRAAQFGGGGGLRMDPLDARGQGAGTLNARISGGVVQIGGLISPEGERLELQAFDAVTLASVPVSGTHADASRSGLTDEDGGLIAVERRLSVGDYRLVAVRTGYGDTIVTGLPLAQQQATLGSLVATTLLVSLAGLVLLGLVGTWIIRRTLAPLEEVSRVAGQVAQLPLDAGEVALAVRVPPSAAHPGTDVGQVGHALNRMLENVAGALEARQASEKRVRQFVADASHELRTPLTAIRGYTDMVRLTETLSPQGTESIARVEAQSRRMGRLVEDLLTLARLDEGQALSVRPVDVTQLVIETVTDQKVIGPDHVWRLELPDEPLEVRADAQKLHQVLVNLLANARTHTPPGTVVTAAAGRDPRGGVVITVTDTGPGIPDELRTTVFSRFARADAARSGTSGEGSTGLGLAIVEAIVEAHGGSVELTSRPGQTVFAVRLPG
ncbi:HAMP domain-containing sensor histidine kinase [Sinomonas halotolerans]